MGQELDMAVQENNKPPIIGVVLIVLLGMVLPFSMDMCLPALPTLSRIFKVSVSQTNLVIVLFLAAMAISMLFIGPVSDFLGRKKVVLPCIIVFIVSNLFCALASSFPILVIFRVLSGLGAGGLMTTSTAMTKDLFSGRSREKMLALNQVFGVLAPIISPVIGAELLVFFSWRASFFALAVVGVVTLILTLTQRDTLPKDQRYTGNPIKSTVNLVGALKDKKIALLVLITGLTSSTFMAYLGTAAFIYIDHFGLTETQYSLFFAINAAFTILGPLFYLRLSAKLPPRKLMYPPMLVIILCGILIATVGHLSPVAFLLCLLFFPVSTSICRPAMSALILKQRKGDAGTLSSLINCCFMMFGAILMMVASLNWGDYILSLGITIVVCTVIALFAFVFLTHSNLGTIGLDEIEAEGSGPSQEGSENG